MSRTLSLTTGKPYGITRVCRIWRMARASIYRHRFPEPLVRTRPGPSGPMPDAALLEQIRAVLSASPFHGEGHRKVWARLRIGGIRTSLRRVLRLMRENDLLAPGRVGRARGPRNHDGTIIPDSINTLWGTDMTTTWTREGQVAVFIAVDHHNAECVGIHAARRGTRFEALEPLRQGCGGTSASSARKSPTASPSDMITARKPCPTPSRPRCASLASKAHRRSFVLRKAMAARNASSAR
jgi:putative transposase